MDWFTLRTEQGFKKQGNQRTKTGKSKNKNRGINKWERRELRVTCKMFSSRVTKRAAAGWRWMGGTPLCCERDVPRWSL